MTRRPGRELAKLPHHVYIHRNAEFEVLYVGRTSRPDVRPYETKARPWMEAESAEVSVSPAMSFEAATWVEAELIKSISPRHNIQHPDSDVVEHDWRVERICDAEGVDVNTAKWFVRYFPADPDEFEVFLAKRVKGVAEFNARVAAGEDAMAIVAERMDEAMGGALSEICAPKRSA